MDKLSAFHGPQRGMTRDCYASLAIQKALETYGQKVEKDCKIPFWMRIGLNSGPVIVGSVGKDLKMDCTAVGDTVNLASGMQSAFGQILQSSGFVGGIGQAMAAAGRPAPPDEPAGEVWW